MAEKMSVRTLVRFTEDGTKDWGFQYTVIPWKVSLDEDERLEYWTVYGREINDSKEPGNWVEIATLPPYGGTRDYLTPGDGEFLTGKNFQFYAAPVTNWGPKTAPIPQAELIVGVGDTKVVGSAKSDVWFGTDGGDDLVYGLAGNDSLGGHNGDDLLDGGFGKDILTGGTGSDRLKGGIGADDLNGGSGTDTADYSDKVTPVVATLNGTTTSSIRVGAAVEDSIRNIENLIGGSGDDKLQGDILANRLTGGAGRDALYAGLDDAKDVFVFSSKLDSGQTASAADSIYQFDSKSQLRETVWDRIDLSSLDADNELRGDQQFRFVSKYTSVGADKAEGQVRIQDAGAAVYILIDMDGNSTTDMIIRVRAVGELHAADMLL